MPPARFVFFDFFGTLVDYDPSIHPAVNAPLAFAQRVGADVSEDEVSARWQRAWDGLDEAASRTGREFSMLQVAREFQRLLGSPPTPDGVIETLVADYLAAWSADVSLAPDALECVADLASDHRLAVVSNTHSPTLVPDLVLRFGLDAYVQRVITSVELGWRKPYPGVFEAALAEHGAVPADVVFVGDNWAADVDGPRAAGMRAVYVGPSTPDHPGVPLCEVPRVVRAGA